MPREIVTIECTEARKEGKSPSRYTTTRNKKLKTEKLELKKYNPALRRHTLHREIKQAYLCLAKHALINPINAAPAVVPFQKSVRLVPSPKLISRSKPWISRTQTCLSSL